MKILVIEDSQHLRRSLIVGLSNLGFTVEATGDGSEGLNLALYNHYDLIILDLMLPSIDGMTLLKTIRQENIHSKVIILSARVTVDDRVNGLLAGADDYLVKPFSFDELHARIMSIQKRGEISYFNNVIKQDDFVLDTQQKSFAYQNSLIDLTKNEFKIIEAIFSAKGNIVSTSKISEAVVGHFDELSKNSIEAHLSSVRRKTKLLGGVLPIKNKRGFGYLLEQTE
ncbi:response regulator transcription factor [Psychromonas sp. SR45-3]|uniref:response regulator transcription factor n=1 Tax=Psychromonas sp. SR45-3 TaxID=2760930 RepID=UPI0015FD9DDA|nr:response regulator transcription factor [Psychromonas sp. SR45-3]MBB1274025.1 response regulator transcription factor [Psychromonas sp. SR45-3]